MENKKFMNTKQLQAAAVEIGDLNPTTQDFLSTHADWEDASGLLINAVNEFTEDQRDIFTADAARLGLGYEGITLIEITHLKRYYEAVEEIYEDEIAICRNLLINHIINNDLKITRNEFYGLLKSSSIYGFEKKTKLAESFSKLNKPKT